MIQISEWFPNPKGSDAQGEWVELFNDSGAVNLSGWYVQTGNGKKFFLHGSIGNGDHRLFPRSVTKLTLRNAGESISLFDGRGNLIDESRFLGEAPEGKSVNRVLGENADVFARLGEPTPGAANKIAETTSLMQAIHPFGDPINEPLGTATFLAVLLGSSALLAAAILYAAKHHTTLSYLFFDGDEAVRRTIY